MGRASFHGGSVVCWRLAGSLRACNTPAVGALAVQSGFRVEGLPGGEGLALQGHLTFHDADALRAALHERAAAGGGAVLDLSGVESLDAGAASIIAEMWNLCHCEDRPLELRGARAGVKEILELYTARELADCLRPPPHHIGILDQLGGTTLVLLAEMRQVFAYIGELTTSSLAALHKPSRVRWSNVPGLVERLGADGVPIVCMIAFLVGLVTAFQAAAQLHEFGADLLIADLVGLSITRELGPLMTAIIVAGRCGASIAAEIGTMRVSEEVDALQTMGICPHGFLVLPRILALLLVTPMLTLLADVVGLLGGLLIATFTLDIPPVGFMIELRSAIGPMDIVGGLIKAVFFGGTVALIACERGLATRGGAEGVGRSTTSAVVTSLFHLIALDALLTIVFQEWGI